MEDDSCEINWEDEEYVCFCKNIALGLLILVLIMTVIFILKFLGW